MSCRQKRPLLGTVLIQQRVTLAHTTHTWSAASGCHACDMQMCVCHLGRHDLTCDHGLSSSVANGFWSTSYSSNAETQSMRSEACDVFSKCVDSAKAALQRQMSTLMNTCNMHAGAHTMASSHSVYGFAMTCAALCCMSRLCCHPTYKTPQENFQCMLD